jgi:hypothetical protein
VAVRDACLQLSGASDLSAAQRHDLEAVTRNAKLLLKHVNDGGGSADRREL